MTGDLPAPPVSTEKGPLIDSEGPLEAVPKVADARSWELFLHSCSNAFGKREITLFLDGTVRYRVRDQGGEEVRLGELDSKGLALIYRRLHQVQSSIGREGKFWTKSSGERGLSGEFLQDCVVDLHFPGTDKAQFLYSPVEVTPLWLGQLGQIAENLSERAEPLMRRGLPMDYQPRHGDLLRRRDGAVFRFVGVTTDKKAWMMEEVGQPTTNYYPVEDIDTLFVALVKSSVGDILDTPPGQ